MDQYGDTRVKQETQTNKIEKKGCKRRRTNQADKAGRKVSSTASREPRVKMVISIKIIAPTPLDALISPVKGLYFSQHAIKRCCNM